MSTSGVRSPTMSLDARYTVSRTTAAGVLWLIRNELDNHVSRRPVRHLIHISAIHLPTRKRRATLSHSNRVWRHISPSIKQAARFRRIKRHRLNWSHVQYIPHSLATRNMHEHLCSHIGGRFSKPREHRSNDGQLCEVADKGALHGLVNTIL